MTHYTDRVCACLKKLKVFESMSSRILTGYIGFVREPPGKYCFNFWSLKKTKFPMGGGDRLIQPDFQVIWRGGYRRTGLSRCEPNHVSLLLPGKRLPHSESPVPASIIFLF